MGGFEFPTGTAESAAAGGSNRETRGARNPMQRRCADRPVSPFRRVDEFRDQPPHLSGLHEQARSADHPQDGRA
jgi:hypothetical protein